ncbi:MAG: PQQ-dependent sugar dehydrogenase [bacterium]|nr:PQQ-dependent sugar dehydrogenase [bacterium]
MSHLARTLSAVPILATLLLLTASAASVDAQPPGDLALNSLGIAVSTPLAARNAADGTDRLFIVERDGTILIYEPGTGLLGSPFLNIISDVDTTFEGGLLGLAFHPDFATNGYFYVNYTRTGTGGDALTTVIDRFEVSAGDPDDADETSRVEILTIGQPAANHNGGDIHFGPDGYLYIGMGDGASSATSQNTSNLLGKMLRIDPCDTSSCPQPYTIPADNPFVGGPELDEIWGIGFRNPYRWSFDRDTGDLLIADVGAGSREEVSFEDAGGPGGLNYGWNCREGDIAGPGGCSGTFVEPVMVYPHTSGNCSITGGFRYRGCITGLRGTYVFGDFCTAKVFFGTEDSPGNWSFTEWDDLGGSIYGFGEDEDGELYLLQGSSVHRFESASDCEPPDLIFADGFESGDTSIWDSAVP